MKPSICTLALSCFALWSSDLLTPSSAQDIAMSRDANASVITIGTPRSSLSPTEPPTEFPLSSSPPPPPQPQQPMQPHAQDDFGSFMAVSSDAFAIATGNSSTFGSSPPPPTTLIPPTDAMRNLAPPKYLDTSSIKNRAVPTNNWWGNIIAYDKNNAIQPVWSNPYAVQLVADTAPFGLAVSYPYRSRVAGGSSGNSNANRYYAHGIVREFQFSAAEFATRPTIQVTDWADIGVKLQLKSSTDGAARIETHLVSGMAYVSASYMGGLTPKLVSVANIQSINGRAVGGLGAITDSKFEIQYNSGQKWVLYSLSSDGASEKPITLSVEAGSVLKSSAPFEGMLRVTLALDDSWLPTLDKHKTCVVQTATIDIESDTQYAFKWKNAGNCASGLLQYAMHHQKHTLDAATATPVDGMITYSTTRGALHAVVSPTTASSSAAGSVAVWKLTETQVIAEDFYPTRKISAQVATEQKIKAQLERDISSEWSIPLGGSYYFNGKAAQKYASLCLMASDTAIVGGNDKSLLTQCLSKLRTVLAPFLTNAWTHKLQYDRVYGGIVSSEGFVKNDMGADFGNTIYNDHHFHYGYWIYTAAVVRLLDPTWSELSTMTRMATLLARDVANYEQDDQFFPRFRAFDWFRGHSYSHGVTPFADGKDQESTSEDMNFSYALLLLGKATQNSRMATVGTLMARVNAHAVRTYFLLDDANEVHPASFTPNKVTGIFFDNKVDYATWFSAEKHCIHGIQMIPISPMTAFVRSKAFVAQEWDQVLAKTAIVANQDTGNTWLSLLYANYATVDKAEAMRVLQKTKMDDGLTRAWALYMAASQA